MSRSLDFIKNKINSEELVEINYIDILSNIPQLSELERLEEINIVLSGENDRKRNVKIIYNPNASFEYYTSNACTCDGTLYFMNELIYKLLDNIFNSNTYNKNSAPDNYIENLWDYDIEYVVGNFITMNEFGEFGTNEKPWMHSRFTAMLPLICNIKKKKF